MIRNPAARFARGAELDALIDAAEHAVIDGDRRLARDAEALKVAAVAGGLRVVGVAVAVGLALLIGSLLGGRRQRSPRALAAPPVDDPPAGAGTAAVAATAALAASIPWERLMPQIWPRMPPSVQARISGERAGFWLSIAVPILLRFGPRLRRRR